MQDTTGGAVLVRVATLYTVLMMTGMGLAQAESSVRPSLKTSPSLQVRNLQEEDMAVYLIGDQMKTLEDGTLRLEGGAQVRRIDLSSKATASTTRKKPARCRCVAMA